MIQSGDGRELMKIPAFGTVRPFCHMTGISQLILCFFLQVKTRRQKELLAEKLAGEMNNEDSEKGGDEEDAKVISQ